MSYLALYRKMRPKNFDQVVGQEHIIKTLCNQIKSDRISHAYLFCGTRGTGKTSTAKIFAKAVNCENPIDGQPCGECEVCKKIDTSANMNIIEIDAASNNGVENIREIRDEVKYPPTEGKFKVYIIDEVHMLSIGAFNALLKTLEEPPAHIIFILATTDPQKIPVTIHSRCQRFDFKRISAKEIFETLKKYMDNEGVTITDEAINYISHIVDGAMRDALSIIDQCTAFYFGEEITLSKVLEVCGAVDTRVFFEMTDALFDHDGNKCMELIEDIVSSGRDIIQFINDLIVHFRNLLVSLTVTDPSTTLEFSSENIEKYKNQAEKINSSFLIELINNFSIIQSSVKYSSNPRVILEVECIKICNPVSGENIEQLKNAIRSIQKKIENGNFTTKAITVDQTNQSNQTQQEDIIKPKPKAVPEDIKNVLTKWHTFTENFKILDRSFLMQVKPTFLDDKFYIVCDTKGHFDKIKALKDDIETKLKEVYEKEFFVFPITSKDFEVKCSNFDMTDVQIDFDIEDEINSKINSDIIWDDF